MITLGIDIGGRQHVVACADFHPERESRTLQDLVGSGGCRPTKVLRKPHRWVGAQRVDSLSMSQPAFVELVVVPLVEGAHDDADGTAVVAHEVGQAALGIDTAGAPAVEAERLAADGGGWASARALAALTAEVVDPGVLLCAPVGQVLDTGEDGRQADAWAVRGRDQEAVHAQPAEAGGLRQWWVQGQPAKRVAGLR